MSNEVFWQSGNDSKFLHGTMIFVTVRPQLTLRPKGSEKVNDRRIASSLTSAIGGIAERFAVEDI